MKTITYNKLVRDKIPDFLQKQNITPTTRILNEEEFKIHLLQKLQEEVSELISAKNDANFTEELADITEVLASIQKTFRIDPKSLKKIRSKKNKERGKFNERIFLISATDSA